MKKYSIYFCHYSVEFNLTWHNTVIFATAVLQMTWMDRGAVQVSLWITCMGMYPLVRTVFSNDTIVL